MSTAELSIPFNDSQCPPPYDSRCSKVTLVVPIRKPYMLRNTNNFSINYTSPLQERDIQFLIVNVVLVFFPNPMAASTWICSFLPYSRASSVVFLLSATESFWC